MSLSLRSFDIAGSATISLIMAFLVLHWVRCLQCRVCMCTAGRNWGQLVCLNDPGM